MLNKKFFKNHSMLCSWKVAVPFPQTAPSKTSQVPALFPSRPANLPPGRGAGPGIAINRNLTDAGARQPRGQLRAESEERAASRRGAGPQLGAGPGPRLPQRWADREEGAGRRSLCRKRQTSLKEPERCLLTRRLERPLLDMDSFPLGKKPRRM